jgi:hypothetical protein
VFFETDYDARMADIRSLISEFANRLSEAIEAEVVERARAQATAALGGQFRRGPGRPPKALALASIGRIRRKAPPQLCPVPGCKNPAAPVFGMVCSAHKDVPKAKIKKYREARRNAKLQGRTQGKRGRGRGRGRKAA